MRKVSILFSLSVLLILFSPLPVFSFTSEEGGELYKGLEELLFTEVPGVITKVEERKKPVSVTTITAEDIKLTPARNMMDLLEIYVPGALFMMHSEGLQPGIRGIISDRKNKLLLIINGKVVNVSGHNGVETDLEAWDLDDIQKIEIIRGPGSVTYGPGAIMGVINVITKNAKTNPGFNVDTNYVGRYNSKGAKFSYGAVRGDYNFYVYGSIIKTRGIESPKAYRVQTDGTYGYWREDLSGDTSDYLRDSADKPHIKLFGDISFMDEWRFWMRYVADGIAGSGYQAETTYFGDTQETESKQNRQIILMLENRHNIDKGLNIKSNLSIMSTDTECQMFSSYSPDWDNGSNYNWNYAEDQIELKSIVTKEFNDIYTGAVGVEYKHSRWGPGWGDEAKDFRMGDNKNIVNGPDSNVLQALGGTTPYYAGNNGWNSDTWSNLGELNMKYNPKLNILASYRFDQNDFSRLLFSPRLAVISDWDNLGSTKFIVQQSMRMNNAEQLYIQQLIGAKPDSEKFQGVEFIYTPKPIENWTPSVSIFYDRLEVLGWNKTLSSTVTTGEGSLYGIELEAKYTKDNLTLGINHSLVDLIYWHLGPGIDGGGFSYTHYRKIKNGVLMTGLGDSINDWSKNTTKLYANLKINDRLTFHTDAQLYWGFEGIEDQLAVVEKATKGTAYEAAAAAAIEDARSYNAGRSELKINMSVSYQVNDSISASAYVMNLIKTNDAKRYYYDSTSLVAPYPTRISWVEEPRIVGVKVTCKF